MLFVIFWHVQYTWTKEEHVTISISILKHYSLGTLTIVMILTPKCWEMFEHLKTNLNDFRAWSAFFHLNFLLSSYHKLYTYFFHCIGSNHVNVRTRFCFKNNARRVLRSPSARAGNTMAKRKRTITDLQNISPTAKYFFTGNKNQIFIFWT